MNVLRRLDNKVAINGDRREIRQAYLRFAIFIVCAIYCFAEYDTPYLRAITLVAVVATFLWIVAAWLRVGNDSIRHVGALLYDCLIIGLVMVGFGSGFMGMFAVLLWVSLGYGLRYRNPLYLKLGMICTSLTFVVSAMVTHWENWGIFVTLLVTLIVIPLAEMRPMTEMINLLERLDTANKNLDQANQTKRRFISDLSHDLLTPVSSIIGYCQLSPPSIDGIRINAYQLTRMIRAIIGRSAAEDLTYDEPRESFVPSEILKQVAAIVKPLADSRGISIAVNRSDVTGTFAGPCHSLSICLMNLVNNAAKHSAGTTVALNVIEEGAELVFDVSDDGVGIPMEDRELIFTRFHRGALPPKVDGLGLGLAIVKDTIERAGGSVTLASADAGTTFRLRVPVEPAEPSYEPVVAARPSPQPMLTERAAVLFVDDEFQSRMAWASVLREAGYSVHAASSGPDALAAIDAGNQYEICVVDYRMPEMTGIELAAAIREREPTMKILAISADIIDARPSVFSDAMGAGLLDDALQKPLHPLVLLSTVQKLLSARQAHPLNETLILS